MCLAIYKPEGTEIPHENLKNAFDNHNDGAGFAWSANGVLYVKKGIFNVKEVIDQYEKVKQYPCLIHFRKATHGKVDAANCHPFLFNDGKLALIHNGILNIRCSIDGLSDTAHFVKLVLEPLVKIYGIPINNGSLNYLICTSIGSDKLAIMENTGKTYIFNEDKGTWDAGVWYSNTSFRWGKVTVFDNQTNNNDTYFPRKYFSKNSYHSNSDENKNFRKHWNKNDEKSDESYIEFWRRVGESASLSSETDSKMTKVAGLLQYPHIKEDSKNDHTIIEVDTEEIESTVDEAGNVKDKNTKHNQEGQMCEYGWWDEEVEASIENLRESIGLTREESLIRILSGAGA